MDPVTLLAFDNRARRTHRVTIDREFASLQGGDTIPSAAHPRALCGVDATIGFSVLASGPLWAITGACRACGVSGGGLFG